MIQEGVKFIVLKHKVLLWATGTAMLCAGSYIAGKKMTEREEEALREKLHNAEKFSLMLRRQLYAMTRQMVKCNIPMSDELKREIWIFQMEEEMRERTRS